MSAIGILSEHIANQIAAGEVVERPVAVVKELVENSLDAGATQIEIAFRNGGKSYIRVEDNGCGMSLEDARLALERHATSKILEAEDLQHITTFGFRGEALPSIASVARFTLRTRTIEQEAGTERVVNGGKFIHQRACGMPVGTVIEVTDLFYSVPARREFLKTDNTESAHIIYLSRLLAIAHPQTAFRLWEDDRLLFNSPICSRLRERVEEIWGQTLTAELIELEAVGEAGLRLYGLIGKPGFSRSTRQGLITFVNRRPVESRTLSYALIEAYHTLIPKGRHPVAFLFLEIDPEAIDVNVHPAKREVRFQEESLVRQYVIETVIQKLQDQLARTRERTAVSRTPRSLASPTDTALPKPAKVPSPPSTSLSPGIRYSEIPDRSLAVADQSSSDTVKPSLPWRLIGRLYGRYALFETEAGLVCFHLRAAHERIWFERIQRSFLQARVASQTLLLPLPLELEPLGSAVLQKHLPFFTQSGFGIGIFGRHFFRIEAIPSWLAPEKSESFLRDAIQLLREQRIRPEQYALAYEPIARLAATRSLRIDDLISDSAIVDLAKQLMGCDYPLSCPRGHPTYFELSRSDLDKRFGR